ncbi:uncharacterized protein LOC134800816 [Cydia splendana]|uniref:uncharacterized protein LOC134800816 n=1 Tax=Cydia splendana TaxID=1100963 RepID=UPI00300C4114
MNYITEHLQRPPPWSLLYADDVVLISETLTEVQEQLNAWQRALERHGLRVNRDKTEYMMCNLSGGDANNNASVMIEGSSLKQVQEFKYLGSIVAPKQATEKDIQHRITTAWLKWRSLSGVLCDTRMPIKLKGQVYKQAVRPALIYGSECWPMRKEDEQRIHVTEMKMLRWAGGVTRLDRIRNEYIRGTFKVIKFEDKLRENRLRWYGHVMRRDQDHMTRAVMQIEEMKRGRGRPAATWKSTIEKDLKANNVDAGTTQNRLLWRTRTRRADPK